MLLGVAGCGCAAPDGPAPGDGPPLGEGNLLCSRVKMSDRAGCGLAAPDGPSLEGALFPRSRFETSGSAGCGLATPDGPAPADGLAPADRPLLVEEPASVDGPAPTEGLLLADLRLCRALLRAGVGSLCALVFILAPVSGSIPTSLGSTKVDPRVPGCGGGNILGRRLRSSGIVPKVVL